MKRVNNKNEKNKHSALINAGNPNVAQAKQKHQVDSAQNLKRLSLMLNGKAKIMTDFGDKKTQEANRTTIKSSEKFQENYSP